LSIGKESVEAYSNLFAQTANNHASVDTKSNGENHQSTQNGIVIWTSREKEILFNILDRKGRNGIPDIARAIGSKSELEVQEHLRLLHRGLEWQHQKDRHSRTVILGDVPAAAEISSECCNMLDEYAKHLALREQQDENVAGRKKHHDMWIIDRETAELVDEQVESQEENLPTSSSVYHTAGLLNIPRWIRLSERLFMNFGGERLDDNWVNVAYADETPSVTADAFADFYALTVSVTRRLVQSALFFAMSRLRNMRETGNHKARVVRSRDIKTALDVLNMKRDGYDYWAGLARRCSLEVSDVRHLKGWKSVHLDHDEVEAMLSGEIPFDTEWVQSTSRQRSESRVGSETDGGHTADTVEYDSDSGSEYEPEHSPIPSTRSSPEVSGGEGDPEDEHAEQIDQKVSCLEEAELWKALSRPAPAFVIPIKEEGQDNKPRKPIGERKTVQDLVDWREKTLYRSDWEEYGHEVYDIYEEISEERRKRRRLNISGDQPPSSNDGIDNQANEASISSISNKDGQNHHNEDIDPSEGENESMEMDDPSAPDQDPTIHQDEDQGSEVSRSDSRSRNPQHKYQSQSSPKPDQQQTHGSDASSAPASPTKENNIGYRSPILTRRMRIKVDRKKEEEANLSSSSDDDLPRARRRYSSSSEDDRNGMPLHSQPMSPTDWSSD
jgi:hypothetical protein